MPLIQADDIQYVALEGAEIDARLQRPLRRYMTFSGASLPRVLSGAVEHLFRSDRDFQEWMQKQKDKETQKSQNRKDRAPVQHVTPPGLTPRPQPMTPASIPTSPPARPVPPSGPPQQGQQAGTPPATPSAPSSAGPSQPVLQPRPPSTPERP